MQKILSITLVIAIIAAVLGFVSGPLWAFYDIRSAGESEDVASLSKLIAFDQVRTSLKSQLEAGRAGVAAPDPNPVNDPVGATGSFLDKAAKTVGSAIDAMVNPQDARKNTSLAVIDLDSYLSPKGILSLTYGAGRDTPRTDPKTLADKAPVPRLTYWSLARARLLVKGANGAKTVFTFERTGIVKWQLVHIGLPEPTALVPQSISSISTNMIANPAE